MTIEFPVDTLEDTATGAVYLLPTEPEIETDRKRLETTREKAAAEGNADARARLEELCREIEALIARKAQRREKYLAHPDARRWVYTLKVPLYGEMSEAEQAATTIREYEVKQSPVKLQYEVLKRNVLSRARAGEGGEPEKMDEAKIRDLAPGVARLIADKLLILAYPNAEELDFFGL